MNFHKTIGHEKQKQIFRQLAQNQNLAHAYALVGPHNIGKTTFAVDLAEGLGVNPSLDLFVFDSESGLSIEEARILRRHLSRTAAVSPLKVAIVSNAERMTSEAASALLKVLEEPPRNSIIFLTTANFYGLLPTVASRLQRINFSISTKPELDEALKDFGLDPEKFSEIADFSGGRVGLAKTIASSEEAYNFIKTSAGYYQILKDGNLVDRLQTAEKLAAQEPPDIEKFVGFAMQKWVGDPATPNLGKKLMQAFADLRFNLNTKLLMTNLFLPPLTSPPISGTETGGERVGV